MYLTNHQLIDQRTENWGDLGDFSDYLVVIQGLVKKYGSSNVKGELFDQIKTVDAWLSEVIQLLIAVGKLDLKKVSSLLTELGWWSNEWYVVKSINADKVEWEIQASADKVSSTKIEVQISGDGKIYKRGLDRDLGKMLS